MHDRPSTCALPQDLLKFFKLLVIQESYLKVFILSLACGVTNSLLDLIKLIENIAFIIICPAECAQ